MITREQFNIVNSVVTGLVALDTISLSNEKLNAKAYTEEETTVLLNAIRNAIDPEVLLNALSILLTLVPALTAEQSEEVKE